MVGVDTKEGAQRLEDKGETGRGEIATPASTHSKLR